MWKDRLQTALKKERGLRLTAAEVQSIAGLLGLGFPSRVRRCITKAMAPEKRPPKQGKIRWMIRRDMPEVLQVDGDGEVEDRWTEEYFIRCLRQRNCIGMVLEQDERVRAFFVYELHKSRIHILRIAVAKDQRMQTYGTQLIDKLKGKLSFQRRTTVSADVNEKNLALLLFLREKGFRAVKMTGGEIHMKFSIEDDGEEFVFADDPDEGLAASDDDEEDDGEVYVSSE